MSGTVGALWWAVPLALLGLGVVIEARVRAVRAARAEAEAVRAGIRRLAAGQHQLVGALTQVAEAQAAAQARLMQGVDARLGRAEGTLDARHAETAAATARSLGALGERLAAIDRAQANLERLSGEMLALQDILGNKQARGLFGEAQMAEILAAALPAGAYRLQATLPNGRRADCVVDLPPPAGPLAIDSKFPLEAYEEMLRADGVALRERAARGFRLALRRHARDIAERYIMPGETAEGALMFLPSEAVYAEAHARFGEAVREAQTAGVWIVSPTTLMAVLTTLAAVQRDLRIAGAARQIRGELAELGKEMTALAARADRLERHLRQGGEELDAIARGAERARRRAARLEALDFDAPQAAE